MRTITLLDQVTIDKIAAGEVVERPSSIVKELVENAIDAGANAITAEIRDGGISFIRITDNGGGIPSDQIRLAFARHATSKLSKIEDLLTISSLGFRGEALSSIAAVSQVELITRESSALTGSRYLIEGGVEKSFEEIGAPLGTTFLIRNLFYNTPARAKFLKSPTTEGSYIGSLMEQMALSHPGIAFKYIQNGQNRLSTSGNGNLKEVIYQIYGREITKELKEVRAELPGFSIQGFIGKPTVSRGNRAFENYYVNGRYVKSNILTKAIEDAYRSFMMQHKFPFTVLFLSVDADKVDVNVHPAKREVRFQDADLIYQKVYRAVNEALTQQELIPEVYFERRKKPEKREAEEKKKISIPEPFETKRREILKETNPYMEGKQEEFQKKSISDLKTSQGKKITGQFEKEIGADKIEKKSTAKQPERQQMSLFDEKRLLDESSRRLHRLIGQVFDTYWLVQMEDKLFIIDQHAAHEKVLYETLVRDLKNKEITSQYLAVPLVISLNLSQLALMEKNSELFRKFGFEIEPFGGKEYAVRAVPYNLYSIADEKILIELLDSLESEVSSNMTLELFASRLATMACKAAVKGNQKLSFQEAESLIDQLLTLENPYHCPHGRPTIISMSRYELEKKFKRIV